MAIKPSDLHNSQDVIYEADRIEKMIDQALKAQAPHFDGHTVCINASEYPGRNIIEELRRRYLAADWKSFEYVSDQRDGSWYELKA